MGLLVRAWGEGLWWGAGEAILLPSGSSPLSLLLVFDPGLWLQWGLLLLRSHGRLRGASAEPAEELSERPQSSRCPQSSSPCHSPRWSVVMICCYLSN